MDHRPPRPSACRTPLCWGLVTLATLQRLAQDVLLGDAGEGDRVLEDVYPKVGVELLHFLKGFKEGGNVKVVVVLEPVAEGSHTTLLEDALAVGVLLRRENVRTLELGIPSKVGRKPGVIQLVWAVEPLVREPGLGKRGPVSLDPLVVSDAGGQVVHYIQELELGSVNEHDATVLLRSEDAFVLCHDRHKVLADELEIVVARVEPDHRHLVDPAHDEVALGDGDSLWVWRKVPVCNISYDGCMASLKRLVEEMDQLVGILGGDVLRLRVECVRNGYGDGYVLAFEGKVARRAGSLGLVLVRLEVVDNRVGVSLRLLLRTTGVCPRGWDFVSPLLHHCVASVAEMLGSLQSEPIRNLPRDCLAPVHSGHLLSLGGGGGALLAPVPKTTMVLEDRVGLGVITINGNVEDVSLTSMATQCVMNVNAPLLCLPLEPFGCDEAALVAGIEGSLVGRCRGPDTLIWAVNFGLPTGTTACNVPNQVTRLGESGLAIPTSEVLSHLFDVSDQKGMPLVKTHCQNRPTNFVIVGWKMG